jgi:tetratricopeptide (TPR) repeat protein
MSILRRWLSADYRAGRTAEAAGNPEQAAQHYALAGDFEAAVRMHLARAARASDRAGEISALRDALHWAGEDPVLRKLASGALGRALLAKALAEGVATQRDHEKVREAAALLTAGGEFRDAGKALEQLGDYQAAAAAYSSGGLVELMEAALTQDEQKNQGDHHAREAFADYELHLRLGRRDDARASLERALELAPSRDRRRLLDDLLARMITSGKVELRPRGSGLGVVASAGPVIGLGRDALCDLPLRAGGVSRRHAEIEIAESPRFALRDAGSRNGTLLGGLPIAGKMPLADRGVIELGEDCRIEFTVSGDAAPSLALAVQNGLDRGRKLVAARAGDRIDLTAHGIACDLIFVDGRPWLGRASGEFRLGGDLIAHGRAQLLAGDVVTLDGTEIDVFA